MITWMQKHKKWLIITIWVSTIAFIGAGFVGWGAYSYGDKASAVAKVGDVEITYGEFQKTYSDIYAQYAQMFQGNFDQEKAKMFGIDKQALQRLIQQALLLNLAKEYDLAVSDIELTKKITSLPYFQTKGKFDKKLYKEVLSRNNIKVKDFEENLRKELLIAKTLSLLPVKVSANENRVVDTIFNIADKIKYKELDAKNIKVTVNEKELKAYWEKIKDRFKTPTLYVIAIVEQEPLQKKYSQNELTEYYQENKTHFRAEDGKILPFSEAKAAVEKELNAKETKKEALRKFIAFKKGKLAPQKELTISEENNPYGDEVFAKIKTLSNTSAYLKPVKVGQKFLIIKLVSITPSTVKSFEEAKAEVMPLYIKEQKSKKLLALAKKSLETFNGTVSDFVTLKESQKLTKLDTQTAKKFLAKLFKEKNKRGYIVIDPQHVILYDILEQKLLTNTHMESAQIMTGIKQNLFDENLIKLLQNKYDIEIFYKGL